MVDRLVTGFGSDLLWVAVLICDFLAEIVEGVELYSIGVSLRRGSWSANVIHLGDVIFSNPPRCDRRLSHEGIEQSIVGL